MAAFDWQDRPGDGAGVRPRWPDRRRRPRSGRARHLGPRRLTIPPPPLSITTPPRRGRRSARSGGCTCGRPTSGRWSPWRSPAGRCWPPPARTTRPSLLGPLAAPAAEARLSLVRDARQPRVRPDGRTPSPRLAWSIQLWDTATGDKRLILEGHRHLRRSLAFAPDGRALLSAGRARLLGGQAAAPTPSRRYPVRPDRRPGAGRVHRPPGRPRHPGGGAGRGHGPVGTAGPGDKSGPTAAVTDVPTGRPRAVLAAPGPVRTTAALTPDRAIAVAVRGDLLLWPVAEDVPPADPVGARAAAAVPPRPGPGRVCRSPRPARCSARRSGSTRSPSRRTAAGCSPAAPPAPSASGT